MRSNVVCNSSFNTGVHLTVTVHFILIEASQLFSQQIQYHMLHEADTSI